MLNEEVGKLVLLVLRQLFIIKISETMAAAMKVHTATPDVATAVAAHDVISMCGVCMEKYTDPRVLHCSHKFCFSCQQKVTKGHPQRAVLCPTCHPHLAEKGVRYTGSKFESKIQDFLSFSSQSDWRAVAHFSESH